MEIMRGRIVSSEGPVREIRAFPLVEFRFSDDDGAPRITGHAAVFNQLSVSMWGFREKIDPAAFDETLSKDPDIRFLLNHSGLPLARTRSKTLKVWRDGDVGLAFDTTLDPADPDVQRTIPKMKRGDLDQMSFAFWVLEDELATVDGETLRTLIKLDLDDGDVSLVTYPAYPQTSAEVVERCRRFREDLPGQEAGAEFEPDPEMQGRLQIMRYRLELDELAI